MSPELEPPAALFLTEASVQAMWEKLTEAAAIGMAAPFRDVRA
jgi:hypothetical protein